MLFKKTSLLFFLLAIFFGSHNIAFSQSSGQGSFIIDGLVYGYNFEPSKKLLQKEKQIKVEGVLDNVLVRVLENGNVLKTMQTSANGLFLLKVKTGKVYTLEFSKSGYASILLTLDLLSIPKEIASRDIKFSGAELILNSFQPKDKTGLNQPFGKLFYNTRGNYFDFETAKFLSKKQREYINNPVSLMVRSVQKNKNNKNSPQSADIDLSSNGESKIKSKDAKEKVKEIIVELPDNKNYYDSLDKIFREFESKKSKSVENINDTDILSLENKIKEARVQFENDKLNASSTEDSLSLKEREFLLTSIESELSDAKKLIEFQKNKISAQRQLLLLTIGFILLLSVLLFLIFRFNKEKKKTYNLLKEKNKKITDSINYASRIQQSILPSDDDIKKILPRSFVYFQPRDTVSGDFYWLSTVKEKIVIACVDCTGHGVPGAFMSLIGNTLLNEIVNEKQIISAPVILKRLHYEIVKALHQDSIRAQSKDGMEMSLCVIDNKTNEIEFAGAMNPLYVVKDNVVTVIKPDIKGIGGENNNVNEVEFTGQTIPIQKGMSVYMFTDGYMDQFGGPENKKFNVPNFKKLLLNIQSMDMDEQKKSIEQSIKKWQGDYKQIDDMLVIGISL
jgi:serine phosphatase RsbU (regulator of sigma subunit)